MVAGGSFGCLRRRHRCVTGLFLSAPGVGLAATAGRHDPPPDSSAPKVLLDLRAKLLSTPREQAKADLGRFRALCDDEGYPLVGNVANKGERVQPSEICAEVRKAAPK